jgi:Fe-S-cluster containining protein
MEVCILLSDESERILEMNNSDLDQLIRVRKLCHQLCSSSCVDQKRHNLHIDLLKERPHWSMLKRDEQFQKIDLGEKIPFDIALPLPARDPNCPESNQGVKLFWETFQCRCCGKCCYTPGAGLFLEREEFERMAKYTGKRKLKALCRYDKDLGAWVLEQPCPFYDAEKKECRIYPIRPQTCTKYPLHPPLKEMPFNLAVDAFCPAARQLAKETLGWWIICENNWARLLDKMH